MNGIDPNGVFLPTFMRRNIVRPACAAPVASVTGRAPLPSPGVNTDCSKIAVALGKSGAEMPGGVYRIGKPQRGALARSDAAHG